jgi:hypothetical protein
LIKVLEEYKLATKIQIRRDTASNWSNNNPILSSGEFGYETDTSKIKVGNGSSTWNNLDYVSGSTAELTAELQDFGIKTNNLESTINGIESSTIIDSALASQFRTLKYLIQCMYGSTEVHSAEIIIANDNSNLLLSQYGDVFSTAKLADFTIENNSGTINLTVTPVVGKTPLTVRFFRTGIRS